MTGADIKEVLRRVQLAKAMQDARSGGVVEPISQQELKASIAEVLARHPATQGVASVYYAPLAARFAALFNLRDRVPLLRKAWTRRCASACTSFGRSLRACSISKGTHSGSGRR